MKIKSALSKDWAKKEKQTIKRIENKLDLCSYHQVECCMGKEPIYLSDKELQVVYWALSAYRNEIAYTDYVGRTLDNDEINSNLEVQEYLRK